MSEIILPGHYADEATDATLRDLTVAQVFNELLKAIDPCLKLIWVHQNAKSFENPGRWHIFRENPHSPEFNAYWVIQTPEGEYCEPQERHLERLMQMDTYTGKRVYSDFEKARGERKKRAAQKFEDKRREFRETLEERIAHHLDARIAVPGMPAAMKEHSALTKAGA